jgi:hypothetical protein
MTELPSLGRLKQLTLRAIAAYAARCARRALPILDSATDHPEYKICAERAIRLAQEFAGGVASVYLSDVETNPIIKHLRDVFKDVSDTSIYAEPARAADEAARAAVHAYRADASTRSRANEAARAAYEAARASARAAARAVSFRADPAQADPVRAARAADEAARVAARVDFISLLDICGGKFPDLGNRVDPSEKGPLGPLWRNDVPERFKSPGDPSIDRIAAPINLYFDLAEFRDDEIVSILGRLSDLYRSIGGDALVIEGTETLDLANLLEPMEA